MNQRQVIFASAMSALLFASGCSKATDPTFRCTVMFPHFNDGSALVVDGVVVQETHPAVPKQPTVIVMPKDSN
jgi:hypothetical protein